MGNKEQKYDPKSNYYDAGGVAVMDFIKAKLTAEQFEGFLLGNLIKYGGRYNFKESKTADARKAAYYAKWLEELEGK